MTTHRKAMQYMGETDSSMLQQMEYAFENIGFIPKWLDIAMY